MNKFITWSRRSSAPPPRRAENWSITNMVLGELQVVPTLMGAEAKGRSEAGLGAGARTVGEQG